MNHILFKLMLKYVLYKSSTIIGRTHNERKARNNDPNIPMGLGRYQGYEHRYVASGPLI